MIASRNSSIIPSNPLEYYLLWVTISLYSHAFCHHIESSFWLCYCCQFYTCYFDPALCMYDTNTQGAQRPAGQRPAKRREKSGCVCGPQARHRLIRARPAPAAHLQQQHTPLLPSTAAAASVILYPIYRWETTRSTRGILCNILPGYAQQENKKRRSVV